MPGMITYGSEMIRIGVKNRIDRSTNGGTSLSSLYTGSSCGEFRDLLPYGNELLAVTSKGVYVSKNAGLSWSSRCTSSSYGEFLSLADSGKELLATTSKGLYRSTNGGLSWSKK